MTWIDAVGCIVVLILPIRFIISLIFIPILSGLISREEEQQSGKQS